MRANILLPFGLSVALSSAQIVADFSSLTAGPVTSSALNSVTTGGTWYLNPDRGAAFEIQEDGTGDKAILADDTAGNAGTITLIGLTAAVGNEVDLTTHDAFFDFVTGTRRTGNNKGLRYEFLNQAGTATLATLDWLHSGNQIVLNAGAANEDSGSDSFSGSFLSPWDSTSASVRNVSVTFSGAMVTVTFGGKTLVSSFLDDATDVGRARVVTVGSAAAAKGAYLDEVCLSSAPSETALVVPGPIIEWSPTGIGNAETLYQELNWIDPATGLIPPLGTIDASRALNRSLVIRAGNPGGTVGAEGSLLMGTGDLTVNGATLRMSEETGSSINMGTDLKDLTITNGKVFTQAVAGGNVIMDGYSELTLYGTNPLNTGTGVELKSPNCFVYFLNKRPSEVNGSEMSKFTVNGVAASSSNVLVTQYYNGAVLRPKLGGDQVMKGFDGADLTGTKWNFSTGFKGRTGLGFIAHNDGIYNVDGWGSDIWSTADQCRFTYRDQSGDVEVIAKIAWVENTNTWAKGGVMIRSDLSAGSPNAFVFQRPDKQITFQTRTSAGGTTTSEGPVGGTGSVKWVRLVRSGNDFTGYYSTSSASGPWTQVGTTSSITMPTTVKTGIAATSHQGKERGRTNFHEVSTVPSSSSSNFGIFTDSVDIEADWWIEDQISSFLLKKGYMVTLSSDAAGQGFSKFYAATEGDLTVNLPPELDNNVSFMRVLPWRWIAKRGWSGSRADHQLLARTYWNYEWEPTGNSRTNHEFVPMIRGRAQNKEFRWEEVRVRGGQTHFLGFNEPESSNQGDLTVDEAIALWPKAQQNGLRLGSPGRTDGNNGNNWLRSFMAKVEDKGYRVDYICLHNYNKKTAASLKTWLDAEFAKYGKPIWLTEFQRHNNDNPSNADHEAYLAEVIPMLESLDYLERYSYFDFNVGGVTSATATLFDNGPVLNAKGDAYGGPGNSSKPAYENLDQPAWATASLDLENGVSIQVSDGGMITASSSIDPSKISKVEFFVNGVSVGDDSSAPYQLSVESLGAGMQSVYSVVTTNFGETVISSTSQVFVPRVEPLIVLSLGDEGDFKWSAISGVTYVLESSVDLLDWDEMALRVATGSEETASDPDWGTELNRFYRVRRK
ncbi:glycosyl hydrolase [Akkermansiaceae bacterium]|nr:glycosyl hydrolase [Akkermansiaceae bacterium]MDB4541575.1 glycosyl hydrolase [Akkermansiaceae bacterium]